MSEHYHHHHHGSAASPDQRRRLLVALALTWGFALVEAVAGWHGGSLALLADAGHMVTDGAALGLALLATLIAARRRRRGIPTASGASSCSLRSSAPWPCWWWSG